MTTYSDDNFSISVRIDTESFESACEMASRFTAEFSGLYWFSTGRIMEATYDRPTTATLVVRCANGDEWEASPDDLKKFGFIDRIATLRIFRTALVQLFKDAKLFDEEEHGSIDNAMIFPLLYLAETAILYPEDLNSVEIDGALEKIARMELRLRCQKASFALLRSLVDPDPCQNDHHGICQVHRQGSEDKCPNVEAERLLASMTERLGGDG